VETQNTAVTDVFVFLLYAFMVCFIDIGVTLSVVLYCSVAEEYAQSWQGGGE